MRGAPRALPWAVGLVALAAGCATAPDPTRMHFPPEAVQGPEPVERTLANGLHLYLLPDRSLPLIRVYALVRTGSIYEPAGKVGLAGLTGQLLREGGAGDRDADALDRDLAFSAIHMESHIGGDAGGASLDSLTRTFPLALSAFADMLRRPRLDADRLETLKDRVVEGIRRRNDTPQSAANRIMRDTLYGADHPYARQTTEPGIRSITREDVAAFHRRFYVPGNVALGITGDFDPDEMVARVTDAFGDWEDHPVTLVEPPPVPPTEARVVRISHWGGDHVSIRIGETAPSRQDPDYYALALANRILGDQVTMTRLFAEVRTRAGLAYSVGSDYEAGFRPQGVGRFTMSAGTAPENAAPAIEMMLAEAARMADEPVPEAELGAAKEAYLNAQVFDSVSVDQLVRRRMSLDYRDLPRDQPERTRRAIMALTPADLQRAVRAHLHTDRMAIVAVGDRAVLKDALARFGTVEEVPVEALDPGAVAR